MTLLFVLFVQSTLLLSLGFGALFVTRRRGPAVQTLVGRATLSSVALLLLLSPLSGRVHSVWMLPTPVRPSPTLPKREGEEVRKDVGALPAAPSVMPVQAPLQKSAAEGAASSVPTVSIPKPTVSRPNPSFRKDPAPEERGSKAVGLPSLLLLLWLAVCQCQLTRLRRTAQRIAGGPATALLATLTPNPPVLLTHPSVTSPFLAGLHRPAIFLPPTYATDFDADALRAIFVHELAHRGRRDNSWTLATRLLTAVLWFQPLLWLLNRKLEHSSEDACDQAVLASPCQPHAYAACLLSLAERPRLAPSQRTLTAGVAPFRSSVGRRISRILTPGVPVMSPITLRLRLTIAALTLAAVTSGAFLVSSAPAQTQPNKPEPVVPTAQERQWITERDQDKANLKAIGQALIRYQESTPNLRLPDANHWMDQIAPYLPDRSVLFDPFQPGQRRYGYAFNRNCSKQSITAFASPNETIVVFDSTLGTRNASDTGASLRINPGPDKLQDMRITPGSNCVFVDGHVKFFTQSVHPSFSLKGGEPTTSDVVVFADGNIRISGKLNNGSLELQTTSALPESQKHQVVGRIVYEDRRPASKVIVNTRMTNDSYGRYMHLHPGLTAGTGAEATSSRDGSYTLTGLLPGFYTITEREASGKWVARALENIPVSRAVTHVRDLVLTHGGMITGTVTNKKTSQPMAKIYVYSLGPRYPASVGGASMTETDAKGKYSLRLAPGDNWIYISGLEANAGYVASRIGISPMSRNLKYPDYDYGFHVMVTEGKTRGVPINAILKPSRATVPR